MLSKKDERDLQNAIELQKSDCENQSLEILEELVRRNPTSVSVNGTLGMVLAKVKRHFDAEPYLDVAIAQDADNELLCLTMYLCCIKLEKFSKAFRTLFDFLEKHPANLFKNSLEELQIGISNSPATIHKAKILHYARVNDVPIVVSHEGRDR